MYMSKYELESRIVIARGDCIDETNIFHDFLKYVAQRLDDKFTPYDFANVFDGSLDMCLSGQQRPGEPPIPQDLIGSSCFEYAVLGIYFDDVVDTLFPPEFAAEVKKENNRRVVDKEYF